MNLHDATRIALILVSLSFLASLINFVQCIYVVGDVLSTASYAGFSVWSFVVSPFAHVLGTGGVTVFLYTFYTGGKAAPA